GSRVSRSWRNATRAARRLLTRRDVHGERGDSMDVQEQMKERPKHKRLPPPNTDFYEVTETRADRRDRNRRTGMALVPLAILLAVLFWGVRGAERVGAAPNASYEELETFTNVLAIIQKNYVEEVDTKRLVEGAINGMLASLDPHSAYL